MRPDWRRWCRRLRAAQPAQPAQPISVFNLSLKQRSISLISECFDCASLGAILDAELSRAWCLQNLSSQRCWGHLLCWRAARQIPDGSRRYGELKHLELYALYYMGIILLTVSALVRWQFSANLENMEININRQLAYGLSTSHSLLVSGSDSRHASETRHDKTSSLYTIFCMQSDVKHYKLISNMKILACIT